MNLELLADAASAEPPGSSILANLLFLAILIAVNAFFAASEIAVISLNDAKVKKDAEQGNHRAKILARFNAEPGRFLATIQVGVTLAGFLASAFAADTFADYVMRWPLMHRIGTPRSIVVVLITVILSLFTLVFGELAPKRIAMKYSEQVAMRSARILALCATLARPVIWLLNTATNAVVRGFGVDPAQHARTVSEEEIRMMMDVGRESGSIEADEKEMIENVFEFNDKTAADLMTHRKDIEAIPWDASRDVCKEVFEESGFSRIPVYNDDIDNIIGVLTVRDYLLKAIECDNVDIKSLMRRPFCVPESIRADVLFRDMQLAKQQMAIVLDEYGGTAGIITLEDLLEEIVGDIYDEYDETEEPSEWEQIDESTYRIRGTTPIDDVSDLLQAELSGEEFHTLGGFIFSSLNVIPSVGSIVKLPEYGLLMTVEKMDGRRVDSVIVRRTPKPGAASNSDAGKTAEETNG